MLSVRLVCLAACLGAALLLIGCDGAAKTAPQVDAGRDAAVADAGRPPDAGPHDAGALTMDAGGSAHETCKTEPMPMWPGFDPGTVMNATRVELSLLCPPGGCPASLQAFDESVRCGAATSITADLEDAGGSCPGTWLRREGCGQVQFDTAPCSWPRHYSYDARTGALIGAARLDDIVEPLRGTSCQDAGYVAGTLLRDCPSVTVRECTGVR